MRDLSLVTTLSSCASQNASRASGGSESLLGFGIVHACICRTVSRLSRNFVLPLLDFCRYWGASGQKRSPVLLVDFTPEMTVPPVSGISREYFLPIRMAPSGTRAKRENNQILPISNKFDI